MPKRMPPIRKLPITEVAIIGRIIRSIGKIGSAAPLLADHETDQKDHGQPRPGTGSSVRPRLAPSSTMSKRAERPAVSRPAPAQSIGATSRCSTRSWTYQASMRMATTANGTLTKKTQRQPRLTVSQPPTSGPAMLESPQTALKRPWILARSSSVNRSPSSVRTIGRDRPRPQALDRPHRDQLTHALSRAREHRPGAEENQAEEQDPLAAEEVGKLAINRRAHGRRQQVGRNDPGIDLEALELGDDRGHGRRDHQLLHRRDRHRHQERGGHHPPARDHAARSWIPRLHARRSASALTVPTRLRHRCHSVCRSATLPRRTQHSTASRQPRHARDRSGSRVRGKRRWSAVRRHRHCMHSLNDSHRPATPAA